jgi:hypothetical protein
MKHFRLFNDPHQSSSITFPFSITSIYIYQHQQITSTHQTRLTYAGALSVPLTFSHGGLLGSAESITYPPGTAVYASINRNKQVQYRIRGAQICDWTHIQTTIAKETIEAQVQLNFVLVEVHTPLLHSLTLC